MRTTMYVGVICAVVFRNLIYYLIRLLRSGSVVEPYEVMAVYLLMEHREVALYLLGVQSVCLLKTQVAQFLCLRYADAESVVLWKRMLRVGMRWYQFER